MLTITLSQLLQEVAVLSTKWLHDIYISILDYLCKYRIAGRYRTVRGYKHKIRTVAIFIYRQIAPMYVLCRHKTVINHKKRPCNWGLFVALHKRSITWLGMRDSNPRMVGPEPTALPLGESPVLYNYTTNRLKQ